MICKVVDFRFCGGFSDTCGKYFTNMPLNRSFLASHMIVRQSWTFNLVNTSMHEFLISDSQRHPKGCVLAWETLSTGSIGIVESADIIMPDSYIDSSTYFNLSANQAFNMRIVGEIFYKIFNRTETKFYSYGGQYIIKYNYDNTALVNMKTVNVNDGNKISSSYQKNLCLLT
jgi:hypothetical protein